MVSAYLVSCSFMYFLLFEGKEPSDLSDDVSDEEWNRDEEILMDVSEESEPEEQEIVCAEISQRARALSRWLTLFLLQFQTRFRLPDSCVSLLFSFHTTFLCILGQFNSLSSEIAKAFPRSLYMARASYTDTVKFRRYVVCRRCHNLYNIHDCVEGTGPRQTSKLCSFKQFPSHPQYRMRRECGYPLVKSVQCVSGQRIF